MRAQFSIRITQEAADRPSPSANSSSPMRPARGESQTAFFTLDPAFRDVMGANNNPKPFMELHSHEALGSVFPDLNECGQLSAERPPQLLPNTAARRKIVTGAQPAPRNAGHHRQRFDGICAIRIEVEFDN
ncbi:hypothetical protein MPLA_140121 [Mesorhizobium sp. ORS 3359]|nr:hypothetical protein MPLA_140121 [Mesorhizobium sp. ORS 3359]